MHLWRPWLALGLLAAFTAGAAVVYKWTDADGVVHYSDQAVPGAEKIVTSPASKNGIGSTAQGRGSTAPAKAVNPLDYKVLAIESPAKEQVFFGDEIVPVRLDLDPTLKPDQEIIWILNGRQLTEQGPGTLSFNLPNLERGTYVLSATVKDTLSGETRTDSVPFYVRQPSALAPLNPLHK
ncbi:MAG: DUF4124 domain-containing protein [Steroidobacteraceae bacterium]|jgi:hypothetical protein